MPTHAERRYLPYTPQQLFDLVADVAAYPAFLPWCLASRVTKREPQKITADLVIGYKMFREKFTSEVTLHAPTHIRVKYLDGPMRHLNNHWEFIPHEDGGTTIDFYLDFEFKSPLLQKTMGLFFEEAVKRMIGAFESRANDIYGAC